MKMQAAFTGRVDKSHWSLIAVFKPAFECYGLSVVEVDFQVVVAIMYEPHMVVKPKYIYDISNLMRFEMSRYLEMTVNSC